MSRSPAPTVQAQHTAHDSAQLLDVDNLEVQFAMGGGWTTVVDGVTFSIAPGETLGIVGESGAGKTVTGLSILRLLPPMISRIRSGSIRFDGQELIGLSDSHLNRIRGKRISMIFQEPMTSLNPAYTIGDQICETLRLHEGMSKQAAHTRAIELLDSVGIAASKRRVDDYPHSFSGGMRQRAMIAMAIACKPDLLIADEPTTALDVTVQATILELLKELQAEYRMAIMYVTHDLGVVHELCERALVMYAGEIVEESAVEGLFQRPRHPYGEGLLLSMPHAAIEGEPLRSIPGAVPPPGKWPQGCRFNPRCSYAKPDLCATDPIELRQINGERVRCARADELDLSIRR